MANDAVALVSEFLSSLGTTNDENVAAYERYVASDVVWDTGSRVLHSLAECIAHLRHLPVEYGVEAFRVNMKHIAGEGHVVLTERVDDVLSTDGDVLIGARVMGVFEVDGDKVVAWRDYYDTAALGREMADAKAARAA